MRTKHAGLVFAVLVLALASGSPLSAAGGSAYFSQSINWQQTPSLYFTVAGGPPLTCGDLWSSRNGGAWVEGQNWICTDGAGSATKGPWTWAGQASDETSFHYIEWPDGTHTNTVKHIWDKTGPTPTITSGWGTGLARPSIFYGNATDAANGAGFDASWAQCKVRFMNQTVSLYWSPAANSYSSSTPIDMPCTISGMPGSAVTWDGSSGIPPENKHQHTNCFRWEIWIYDGGKWGTTYSYFCS